jgi:hypothetical protein
MFSSRHAVAPLFSHLLYYWLLRMRVCHDPLLTHVPSVSPFILLLSLLDLCTMSRCLLRSWMPLVTPEVFTIITVYKHLCFLLYDPSLTIPDHLLFPSHLLSRSRTG